MISQVTEADMANVEAIEAAKKVQLSIFEGSALKIKILGKSISLKTSLAKDAIARGSELAKAADTPLTEYNEAMRQSVSSIAAKHHSILLGGIIAQAELAKAGAADLAGK